MSRPPRRFGHQSVARFEAPHGARSKCRLDAGIAGARRKGSRVRERSPLRKPCVSLRTRSSISCSFTATNPPRISPNSPLVVDLSLLRFASRIRAVPCHCGPAHAHVQHAAQPTGPCLTPSSPCPLGPCSIPLPSSSHSRPSQTWERPRARSRGTRILIFETTLHFVVLKADVTLPDFFEIRPLCGEPDTFPHFRFRYKKAKLIIFLRLPAFLRFLTAEGLLRCSG